ncbi:HDOD domain-containing protein [Pseudomonas cavernae]|uniref:HDOD domain-containing protein n=1 Tax=Pseudomonas cavernae TaxID=2320867 RepID=A0A385Z425_9PSED|nr:HDOD domain-containing protein [Pseudomonas cavernae]AYC32847.1 HDOD domain-containing protein [Pseudomonas cavernae]
MAERSHGLQAWIERLSQAELPALAAVVQDLQRLAQPDNTSVQQLAEVLLRDAALTSKVLRVANSVYYNPSQEPIRTISRAIVLIGFEQVRLIGLSVSLIDHLLARQPREQLQELLARAFHAAVQARSIAGYVLSKHQEEVFIAALLNQLGELAFWGSAGEQADELASVLAQPGIEVEKTVREVLGISFRQLTLGLVKSWNLGELASLAHTRASQHDPAVQAVRLGVQISEAALDGWDSPAIDSLVGQLAAFIGVTPEEALQQVLASADEAVKVAATFGASRLCHLIPHTDPEQIRLQQEQRRARLLQPNLQILQQALQDIGAMVAQRADLNRVLDALCLGLHQGAGLERVMLAVLADGQTCFRVKRAVGEGTEAWPSDFVLPVERPEQPHLFSYVLRHRETLWMGVPASCSLNELVTQPLRQMLGQGMFFIAPLLVGSREIGVLYADRRLSGRALKHEQFVAFQRFSQLTARCLEAMGRRG